MERQRETKRKREKRDGREDRETIFYIFLYYLIVFILFDWVVCKNKNWDVEYIVKWVSKIDKVVFENVK